MSSGRKLFLAAAALSLFVGGHAWAEAMSAADIKKLSPGSYNVSVADSVKARVVLTAKGGISVATDKGEKDSGKWWLAGQKACVQFKKLLDHKPYCSTLTRDGSMLRGDGFTIRF
jgi:hypothetical protein